MKARAALVAVAAALFLSAPANPVRADGPYQVAWWNRLQVNVPTLGPEVPDPPVVERSGILVISGFRSPIAFGAVRYAVDGPVGGTLKLTISKGTALGSQIDACRVLSVWSQGGNQVYSNAPEFSCEGGVHGVVSQLGDSVTWELTDAFYRPDTYSVDVALVPVGTRPSSVPFDPPGPDSFIHPEVAFTLPTGGDGSGGVAPAAPPTDTVALPFIDAPAAPVALPPAVAPEIPNPAPSGTGGNGAAPTPLPGVTPTASVLANDDSLASRVLGAAGLLALVFAFFWFGRKDPRAPRLLGGAAR